MNPEQSQNIGKLLDETMASIAREGEIKPEGERPIDVDALTGDMEGVLKKVIQKDAVSGADAIGIVSAFLKSMDTQSMHGLSRASVETDESVIAEVEHILEDSLKSLRMKKNQLQQTPEEERVQRMGELAGFYKQESMEDIARIKMTVRNAIDRLSAVEEHNGTTN